MTKGPETENTNTRGSTERDRESQRETERAREMQEMRMERCRWEMATSSSDGDCAHEGSTSKARVGRCRDNEICTGQAPACPCAIQPQLTTQPVSTPLLPQSVTEYI
jgi:hypothetical protein